MDFFESQERARRSTWLLIFYFVLAVMLMIAAIYAASLFALGYFQQQADQPTPYSWWQPQLLAIVAGAIVAVITLGSLFKTLQLKGGGAKVAEMLGGRRLHPYTEDLKEQRLLNVVEEMALASGVPVPPVYVLDREDGINAFAAGFTPDDAVIGVNRGTLEYLNRDELQGVMAHEFSHILNGDMRLNLRLIGILHGILVLGILGYYLLRAGAFSGRGRSSKKGGGAAPILIIGLATLIIGYIGLFFGRLIKAAVSRQREYLADASAVQFTRNPDGIAGALKKIGGVAGGSIVKTPEAESASHMFFGSALKPKWLLGGLLATHPPLVERIRKVAPQFDGKFPTARPLDEREAAPVTAEVVESPSHAWGAFGGRMGAQAGPFGVTPALILASVGQTDSQHVQFARDLLRAIPEEIRVALQEPFGARAAIFALLLSDDAVRAEQLEIIGRHEGEPTRQETERLGDVLRKVGKEFRLPVINLAQSTLCELSPPQYDSFRGTIERLVRADKVIDLFEFVVQRVLLEHLDRHFFEKKPPSVRYGSVSSVQQEIECLLTALAHLGHPSEDEARKVFQQAMATLDVPGKMLAGSDCTLKQIGESLDKLNECSFAVKKRIVVAAITSVTADGEITIAEAELLRAIADSIGCPMPPILAGSVE